MQQWEWLRGSSLTPVDESGVSIELKKYACGGMSRAAMNLLREVGPSLVKLHLAGYSIKVVRHSLGGSVDIGAEVVQTARCAMHHIWMPVLCGRIDRRLARREGDLVQSRRSSSAELLLRVSGDAYSLFTAAWTCI